MGPALWGLLGTPSTGKKDSFFRRCHSTMLIKSYTGHSRKKVTWPIALALVKFVSVCTSVCLCGVLECLHSDPHTHLHTERPERSSVPLHYTRPYSLQSVSLTEPSSQLTPETPLLLPSLQHWGYKPCLALLGIQTRVPEQVILPTEPFLSTALEGCLANCQVQIGRGGMVFPAEGTLCTKAQSSKMVIIKVLYVCLGEPLIPPHPGDQQTV